MNADKDALMAGSMRQWLEQLSTWQGRPADYWPHLAQTARSLLGAHAVVIGNWQPTEQKQNHWQVMAVDPMPPEAAQALRWLDDMPASLWQEARQQSVAIGPSTTGQWTAGLASFRVQSNREICLLAVLPKNLLASEQAGRLLSALAWSPVLFERDRRAKVGERDATRLAQILETIGRLLEAENLDRAALVLANDMAERFACEAVSVCWRSREGLTLRAISHTEKVDRRSELTALLEDAGEEALQQAQELSWPGQDPLLQPAHHRYAQLQQPGYLYTLPFAQSAQGEAARHWGSLSLERQKMPFTQAEQWALRLYADMAMGPLVRLHEGSRALPVRLWRELQRSLPTVLKPQTLMGRRLGQALAVAMVLISLVPLPYSVTAGATVKTDTMAFMGAPFDGFLESSEVQLGDQVQPGQPLFAISTRELMLERASIQAEISQLSREAEKRRAANQLPEMQVAEAQVAQAQAKLQQTQQRVQAAAVISPMKGVVIEGEPGKNLGGAVRRGDNIIKVAALSALYVEAAVSEKDLSRILVGQSTRLTLLAQPAMTYALTVKRIIPQASVIEGENAFPVRLDLDAAASAWWRPGMTGVVKIFVGWRPLAWIATHRLIDYLRLTLWI